MSSKKLQKEMFKKEKMRRKEEYKNIRNQRRPREGFCAFGMVGDGCGTKQDQKSIQQASNNIAHSTVQSNSVTASASSSAMSEAKSILKLNITAPPGCESNPVAILDTLAKSGMCPTAVVVGNAIQAPPPKVTFTGGSCCSRQDGQWFGTVKGEAGVKKPVVSCAITFGGQKYDAGRLIDIPHPDRKAGSNYLPNAKIDDEDLKPSSSQEPSKQVGVTGGSAMWKKILPTPTDSRSPPTTADSDGVPVGYTWDPTAAMELQTWEKGLSGGPDEWVEDRTSKILPCKMNGRAWCQILIMHQPQAGGEGGGQAGTPKTPVPALTPMWVIVPAPLFPMNARAEQCETVRALDINGNPTRASILRRSTWDSGAADMAIDVYQQKLGKMMASMPSASSALINMLVLNDTPNAGDCVVKNICWDGSSVKSGESCPRIENASSSAAKPENTCVQLFRIATEAVTQRVASGNCYALNKCSVNLDQTTKADATAIATLQQNVQANFTASTDDVMSNSLENDMAQTNKGGIMPAFLKGPVAQSQSNNQSSSNDLSTTSNQSNVNQADSTANAMSQVNGVIIMNVNGGCLDSDINISQTSVAESMASAQVKQTSEAVLTSINKSDLSNSQSNTMSQKNTGFDPFAQIGLIVIVILCIIVAVIFGPMLIKMVQKKQDVSDFKVVYASQTFAFFLAILFFSVFVLCIVYVIKMTKDVNKTKAGLKKSYEQVVESMKGGADDSTPDKEAAGQKIYCPKWDKSPMPGVCAGAAVTCAAITDKATCMAGKANQGCTWTIPETAVAQGPDGDATQLQKRALAKKHCTLEKFNPKRYYKPPAYDVATIPTDNWVSYNDLDNITYGLRVGAIIGINSVVPPSIGKDGVFGALFSLAASVISPPPIGKIVQGVGDAGSTYTTVQLTQNKAGIADYITKYSSSAAAGASSANPQNKKKLKQVWGQEVLFWYYMFIDSELGAYKTPSDKLKYQVWPSKRQQHILITQGMSMGTAENTGSRIDYWPPAALTNAVQVKDTGIAGVLDSFVDYIKGMFKDQSPFPTGTAFTTRESGWKMSNVKKLYKANSSGAFSKYGANARLGSYTEILDRFKHIFVLKQYKFKDYGATANIYIVSEYAGGTEACSWCKTAVAANTTNFLPLTGQGALTYITGCVNIPAAYIASGGNLGFIDVTPAMPLQKAPAGFLGLGESCKQADGTGLMATWGLVRDAGTAGGIQKNSPLASRGAGGACPESNKAAAAKIPGHYPMLDTGIHPLGKWLSRGGIEGTMPGIISNGPPTTANEDFASFSTQRGLWLTMAPTAKDYTIYKSAQSGWIIATIVCFTFLLGVLGYILWSFKTSALGMGAGQGRRGAASKPPAAGVQNKFDAIKSTFFRRGKNTKRR